MRRDYFTLTVQPHAGTDGELPELVVTYEGPPDSLGPRMSSDDDRLDSEDIDVAFRYRSDESEGVLSITNRLTGEFILEVNAEEDAIEQLVSAARAVPDSTTYKIVIDQIDGPTITWDKETLLVYDADGSLIRERSLIPSGVEL